MSALSRIVVVVVEPETPGNVGFVARAMANFGVSRLRLVGNDCRNEEEARRFAVHAVNVLESATVHEDLRGALHDTVAAWAATARVGSNLSVTRAVVPLQRLPDPTSLVGDVALVFGRESSGLTNNEIDLCDLAFSIPTSPAYASMNLSHAVAVVLYHIYSKYAPRPPRRPTQQRAATREEREQVCKFFDEVVDMLGFKEFKVPIAKRVFRNLVGRAYMTGREVTTLTGTVRRIRDTVAGRRPQD